MKRGAMVRIGKVFGGWVGAAALAAAVGCATTSGRTTIEGLKPTPARPEVTLTHGDARIGSYVSSWDGFRTSSYWIEGPTGLILIDTQFLPSAANEFVDWAERATGKKAVLAIVLHPNPDKFNGTETFQKRGIRVVTSAQVLANIPAVHRLRTEWFYDRFKPDYPVAEPKPESFGATTTTLSAGGITVKAHVMNAGCSLAHVVVEYDGHVFVGDLITQGFHSWLELGLLREWLDRLDEIAAMKPAHVHTGRGGSGEDDLVDRERQYLKAVIAIVKKYKPARVASSPRRRPRRSRKRSSRAIPRTTIRASSRTGSNKSGIGSRSSFD